MTTPSYRKLYWHHADPDDPSLFFYEIVDEWVSRVVELFDTGELRWCDGPDERGGARFPTIPWSDDGGDNSGAFALVPIGSDIFERVWRAATEAR